MCVWVCDTTDFMFVCLVGHQTESGKRNQCRERCLKKGKKTNNEDDEKRRRIVFWSPKYKLRREKG